MFELVTREKSKARIAMTGPSGAGKTLSALLLGYGITGDWEKIALIDTEHERGRFYADRSDFGIKKFRYAPMYAPYSPERYIEYVKAAAQAVGEDGVVILDSFSHAWNNAGGVLEIKEYLASTRKNLTDFSAWNEAGKIQNNLVNEILSVPCHTIVTMRTKMGYAMEVNDRGKTVPVKIGLEPVQRDSVEYEFDISFLIDSRHIASLSKDTTFLDGWSGVITPEIGEQLREWLNEGEDPVRCADCGRVIMPAAGRSALQLIEASTKKFGRAICIECGKAAAEAAKAETNGTETVSD